MRRQIETQNKSSNMLLWIKSKIYLSVWVFLFPLGFVLSIWRKDKFEPNSVVHIGEPRHFLPNLVSALQDNGMTASYIAVGPGSNRITCDKNLPPLENPVKEAIRDFTMFWQHVSVHHIVHLHCVIGVSPYLMELTFLRKMQRFIVVHFRGCEARNRVKNISLHPEINICSSCDYAPDYLCTSRQSKRRRRKAIKYADTLLVTTPDLKDFWPNAVHLPFLEPCVQNRAHFTPWSGDPEDEISIVHATNQPGIEASSEIENAIRVLREKGWKIRYTFVTHQRHEKVLDSFANADLTIGKLKMGYYANAQVESLALGVPTITWVREDLRLGKIEQSGLIMASPSTLVDVIEHLLENPEELQKARENATATARRLHGKDVVISKLIEIYRNG